MICFSMAAPLASKAHWPFHDHACEVLVSLPWIVSGLISAVKDSLVRPIQQWPCHEGANACYATSGVVPMRSTSARQAPNVSQLLRARGLTWLEMIISACKRSRQCHPTRPAPSAHKARAKVPIEYSAQPNGTNKNRSAAKFVSTLRRHVDNIVISTPIEKWKTGGVFWALSR